MICEQTAGMEELCSLEQLPNHQSRGFNIQGQNLFAIHKNDQVFVYHNRCPHLGIPLEWVADRFLDADAELIQCSTHGALFTIHDGICVSGPCSGQALQPVDSVTHKGKVWISIEGL